MWIGLRWSAVLVVAFLAGITAGSTPQGSAMPVIGIDAHADIVLVRWLLEVTVSGFGQ